MRKLGVNSVNVQIDKNSCFLEEGKIVFSIKLEKG